MLLDEIVLNNAWRLKYCKSKCAEKREVNSALHYESCLSDNASLLLSHSISLREKSLLLMCGFQKDCRRSRWNTNLETVIQRMSQRSTETELLVIVADEYLSLTFAASGSNLTRCHCSLFWLTLFCICDVCSQMKGPEKTLEERRSSLDAEIDSLTSILADLESSSPYKPRSTQVWYQHNFIPCTQVHTDTEWWEVTQCIYTGTVLSTVLKYFTWVLTFSATWH